MDCTKAKSILGWNPKWNIKTAVKETVKWSKEYLAGKDVLSIMDSQIKDFLPEEKTMFDGMNENQARKQILDLVEKYYEKYHAKDNAFTEAAVFPMPPESTTIMK